MNCLRREVTTAGEIHSLAWIPPSVTSVSASGPVPGLTYEDCRPVPRPEPHHRQLPALPAPAHPVEPGPRLRPRHALHPPLDRASSLYSTLLPECRNSQRTLSLKGLRLHHLVASPVHPSPGLAVPAPRPAAADLPGVLLILPPAGLAPRPRQLSSVARAWPASPGPCHS